MDDLWYEIENDFWCPCQDKFSSQIYENHSPECCQHKILMKISNSIEYLPGEIPETEHGKKRNSVVDEFLANLDTMNTSRRRSSSKLLPGFVPIEEIVPSLSTRVPGLDVYLPTCFSPTKLERLESVLDQDIFEFVGKRGPLDSVDGLNSFEKGFNEIENVDFSRRNSCMDRSESTFERNLLSMAGKHSLRRPIDSYKNDYQNCDDDYSHQEKAITDKEETPSCKILDFDTETVDSKTRESRNVDFDYSQYENGYHRNNSSFESYVTTTKREDNRGFNKDIREIHGRNSAAHYDEFIPNDGSCMISMKHESKITVLHETTDRLACCSLGETDSNKLSTKQIERNFAERMRRNTMNKRFSNLQTAIPDIAKKKKIPKVDIIKAAVAYINSLEQEERYYLQLKAVEKERNRQLIAKLAHSNT